VAGIFPAEQTYEILPNAKNCGHKNDPQRKLIPKDELQNLLSFGKK